jgi:hypothetical protein
MITLKRTRAVRTSYLRRALECGQRPTLTSVLVIFMVLGGCMAGAGAEEQYTPPTLLDEALWKEHFSGQRILFGLSPDGEFTPYLSTNRVDDAGGHPIETTKLRSLAIEIGGDNTKVCWTSGGDKHCDPPPPQ